MLKQPNAQFRRRRILLALALIIPGTALAWISLLGRVGLLWQLVQVVFIGAGAIIFWLEAKRAKAASRQQELTPNSSDQPPTA